MIKLISCALIVTLLCGVSSMHAEDDEINPESFSWLPLELILFSDTTERWANNLSESDQQELVHVFQDVQAYLTQADHHIISILGEHKDLVMKLFELHDVKLIKTVLHIGSQK
jgi:hypothetical protein